ncbi:hypothetical protein FH972_006486 [Carpinus fangiana]|uniref:Uncharacterized protein n=1 Tax=Carpinus fangiana TaxID=176857 RepID=A0A5N6QVE0_9ROSI|nr:hypothetical protein FH972_006486 [Carpinus fangiana]
MHVFPAKDEKNQIIKHSNCRAIMGSSESTMGSNGSTSTGRSTETEGKVSYGTKVAAAAAIGIGLLAGAAAAVSILSGSETDETNRTTMKAPGKNDEVIYRDDFEKDPKTYFQNLRSLPFPLFLWASQTDGRSG